jgi:predicted CopG family antitoxin
MDRKTITIYTDVRENLEALKKHLKLSNDSDTIKYLISLYEHSPAIPREVERLYIELRR